MIRTHQKLPKRANQSTAKLPLSSSLLKKTSKASAVTPAIMASTATRIPSSDMKVDKIPSSCPPPSAPLSMGDVEPSFSSPSFNPSHSSDDFVAYSFSSLHRRVTPVPVYFGSRRSAVSSEDLLQGMNTEDDETHVPMFQSISPVEHSEDADFATQETLLCHHDPVPPVVYPKAYYNSYYFPVVVHRMIDDVCNELGPELMHWNEEGDYFWIHQTSPKLGTILKRYFSHDRYQSLRRQLNAYGFGKNIRGPQKGYWHHATFCRNSTYDELIDCIAKSRQHHSSKCRRPEGKTTFVPKRSSMKRLPVERKVTAKITKRKKTKKKSGKVKISKASIPPCDAIEMEESMFLELAVSSITDFELFSMDDAKETLLTEMRHNSSSDDALSALATVASFLQNATSSSSPGSEKVSSCISHTSTFSPIVTDLTDDDVGMIADDITNKKPMPDETQSPTTAVEMTVFMGKGHLLMPTPIKLPYASIVDISHVLEMCSAGSGGLDEDNFSYSLGSLSSPHKLLLPTADRSAFTPILNRTDRMISEMCESLVSNMV